MTKFKKDSHSLSTVILKNWAAPYLELFLVFLYFNIFYMKLNVIYSLPRANLKMTAIRYKMIKVLLK